MYTKQSVQIIQLFAKLETAVEELITIDHVLSCHTLPNQPTPRVQQRRQCVWVITVDMISNPYVTMSCSKYFVCLH